ncbi:MAG: putative membrane protein YfcA [Bacteriovoracaceae bacterium]|jgi:uncharacterized membrane protein YfcA
MLGLELWIWIVLGISAVLTSIISAVAGMAGGIVLLSIMTLFLPFPILIPIHGVIQLISNSTRAWFLRANINWQIFKWFCLGLPLGAFLSIQIIKSLESNTIPLLLIAALIFYAVFKPKKLPSLMIPLPAFILIGFGVGFLGPLIGATGPFMAPFFLRDDFNKEQIIATKSSVQVMGHLIKLPAFLYLGFDYLHYSAPIIGLTICAIIGTKLGIMLLHKVDEKLFKIIFKTALLAAGFRILYKVFTSMN